MSEGGALNLLSVSTSIWRMGQSAESATSLEDSSIRLSWTARGRREQVRAESVARRPSVRAQLAGHHFEEALIADK